MSAYKLDDLARLSGVSARTVRYYVQRGLLPAPAFKGSQTTYGEEHLVRLRAIKKLQDARLALEEIEVKMKSASLGELEAIARGKASASKLSSAPLPRGRESASAYRAAPSSRARTLETWDRIVLADGVELHVRSDAPVDARRIALEIESQFSKS